MANQTARQPVDEQRAERFTSPPTDSVGTRKVRKPQRLDWIPAWCYAPKSRTKASKMRDDQ